MLIVKLSAGLANQMFQYAFYRSLLNIGKKAYTDSKSFSPKRGHEYVQLKTVFPNLELNEAHPELIKLLSPHEMDFVSKFKRKYLQIHKSSVLREPKFSFNSFFSDLEGDYYLIGFWQTEKYFKNIKEEIRTDFEFREITDVKNVEILKKMNAENSVSIHVRKGTDYKEKIREGTCDIEYYKKSIAYMKKSMQAPVFYVFSDNKEWVSENFRDFNYTLIDWNPTEGANNYLDMQLMSHCKCNIIANSSYSWWGAWLNRNPNKIVVGPENWFNAEAKEFDTSDILPQNWIKF